MVNDWLLLAAAYSPSPSWSASTVHVPASIMLTWSPLSVQACSLPGAIRSVSGRPALELAATA